MTEIALAAAPANVTRVLRHPLGRLYDLADDVAFHRYLITQALDAYAEACRARNQPLGTALAICANAREARTFCDYAFDRIVISGIVEADAEIREAISRDKRLSYERQNGEAINHATRSFDLAFVKEGLHHLARPVLGVYEMLRVCRQGVVIIEPYETLIGRLLERFGLSSVYESNQDGNINYRDNYVFRFSRRHLQALLNSYYIESGYQLDLYLGWMSTRMVLNRGALLKRLLLLAGYAAGFTPGSPGNYMTAFIQPGHDLPPDPEAVINARELEEVH